MTKWVQSCSALITTKGVIALGLDLLNDPKKLSKSRQKNFFVLRERATVKPLKIKGFYPRSEA